MKKRRLQPEQKVILIYKTDIGFTEELTHFINYENRIVNNTIHETPIFQYKDEQVSGLDCFWILSEDIRGHYTVDRFQRELIWLQIKVLEIGEQMGIPMPNKLKDKKIEEVATYTNQIIKKLGFDPRDESWIEEELAITERERKWFEFERTKGVAFYQLLYSSSWNDIVQIYNTEFKDNISIEQAKKISIKRMRFIMGSHGKRMSGIKDKEQWKKAAREFEEKHRKIEERMVCWSESKKENFPLVRIKKELEFSCGSYFNECIEKIPELFTDTKCNRLKSNILLRIISYDPETRYIKLDFTKETSLKIKPNNNQPWISDGANYIIWLDKSEIFAALDFLGENLS